MPQPPAVLVLVVLLAAGTLPELTEQGHEPHLPYVGFCAEKSGGFQYQSMKLSSGLAAEALADANVRTSRENGLVHHLKLKGSEELHCLQERHSDLRGAKQGRMTIRGGGSPVLSVEMLQALDDALRQKRAKEDTERQQEASNSRLKTVRLVNEQISMNLHGMSAGSVVASDPIYFGSRLRLRQATVMDVQDLQHINLVCLPENYQRNYYWYHLIGWPSLAWVAEVPIESADDKTGHGSWRVVAYVLGKLNEDSARHGDSRQEVVGHITSLAVLRMHRRKSIARRLMILSMKQMQANYQATACSLHVRAGNKAAIKLYNSTLGFHINKVEKGYYADGEDANSMMAMFDRSPSCDILQKPLVEGS